MQNINHHIETLSAHIYRLLEHQPRVIVAIAGAPGSGKSTLAKELSRRMTAQKQLNALVPMDGFHLENDLLEPHGLLARKGAPETFDFPGLLRLVKALQDRENVFAPKFDRSRDIAIAGAVHVHPDCPVVIVEGNYLLLDENPWRELASLWDVTAFLDVSLPELRARLIQRWLSLNYSRTVATRRAESNDIPNAKRVRENLIPADFALS